MNGFSSPACIFVAGISGLLPRQFLDKPLGLMPVMWCRNLKSAGFTPEERESFERLLMQKGFRDVFRERHPDIEAYTYWNYLAKGRSRNGWRIDFFLVPSLQQCDLFFFGHSILSLCSELSCTAKCVPIQAKGGVWTAAFGRHQ